MTIKLARATIPQQDTLGNKERPRLLLCGSSMRLVMGSMPPKGTR